jgi:hypothetical protein
MLLRLEVCAVREAGRDLLTGYAWEAYISELTFEAGNPAVVGTIRPVDRKLCVPTFR